MATDQELHRLHDGELEPAAAQALRAELSAQDQDKLAALAELDRLVAGVLQAEAAEIDLWEGIASQLPAAPAASPVAQVQARSLSRPARRRWAMPATAVAGLLAMAAAFLFFLWPAARPSNRCDVESLEVVGGGAAVLQIPGEHGDSTTVIWMDHEESDEWESL